MVRIYLKKRPGHVQWYYILFDRIIQAVSGRYIHAELEFSDGRFFSSRGEGPAWASHEEVNPQPGDWDVIPIPVTKEQEKLMVNQANIIVAGAFTKMQPKYGWRKIFFDFLPLPLVVQRPVDLICSETVTIELQCVGLLVGYVAEGVSPTDLGSLVRMELPLWIRYQKR